MKFVSTRGGSPAVSLSDAINAGLAPDGGLYVPERLPAFDLGGLGAESPLAIVAERVLAPFFAGDALEPALPEICREAYSFDAPLVALADRGVDRGDHLLELFHGPTAAFKDFGARFLAASFVRLQRADPRPVTVLVATSGDTGSAVGAAFHGRPGVRVLILYPDGLVSPRQAHQLGCFGDNVRAAKLAGSFDDCQRLVKQAFSDAALRERTPLASANSISLGRLLPQMVYYVAAALRHRGEVPLGFVVPTGNLGNAFAALLARACGAPIGPIRLATNANRVLPDFLANGDYQPRPSIATLANAMDVGNPSNVERLRWLFRDIASLRVAVTADSVYDPAIRTRLVEVPERYGVTVCPHTACGFAALERLRAGGDSRPYAVAATAHPSKFDTVVEPLLGRTIAVPAALAAMLVRPARAEAMANDYAALVAAL